MAGYVSRMTEVRSDFKIVTGKSTLKKPLEIPRKILENIIRIDLR
jgi:hypothetical protein